MRLKLIACKALFREISYIAATCENFIDVTYIRQGYHETPTKLMKILQEEIDLVEAENDPHTYKCNYYSEPFDAILLGYGLCSNGVVSLHSEKTPLVIPKVHDCISLLLGSREKYDTEFGANPGTYWYTPSWIENSIVPCEESSKKMKDYYAEAYGEEEAEYIYQTQMLGNYTRCGYINWNELPFPKYEKLTKDAATYLGLDFAKIEGESSMLRDFLEGKWDNRFLYVKPGEKIVADYENKDVLTTEEM